MTQLIGFDVTSLAMPQFSGVSWATHQLFQALLAREDDRCYVPLAHRSVNGQLPQGATALSGAPCSAGAPFHRRWWWMQVVAPQILTELRPALAHFTNSIAPLTSPVPIVLTIHDMSLFLYAGTQPLRSLLSVRPLIPVLARRAAAITTPSVKARQDLIRRLRLPPEKVHVIYNAPSAQYRPITDAAELDRVRRLYELPSKFVLYVGTLEPRKNIPRLLRAFAQVHQACPEVRLIIAGQLGWKHQVVWRDIEMLGLKDAVHWLGYIPADDLPALYSLATVFAFPSLYEGFGLPVIEAMACGTPVITSNRSALAEVADGAALLVDPIEVGAIVEALRCLLADAPQRDELRARGLQRAAQFSWARAAEETARVYGMINEQ